MAWDRASEGTIIATKPRAWGKIYDHHFVEFTYKDGSKLYSQSRQMSNTWNNISEAVHGTKGISNCQSKGHNGRNPYEQEHISLFDAIRKDEKHNDGWYGATSSFTAVLGRMATYSGQVVKWDEAAANGPDEMPKTVCVRRRPTSIARQRWQLLHPNSRSLQAVLTGNDDGRHDQHIAHAANWRNDGGGYKHSVWQRMNFLLEMRLSRRVRSGFLLNTELPNPGRRTTSPGG